MADTKQLIEKLSAEAVAVQPLRLQRYGWWMVGILSVYAICSQCWLEGFRADVSTQLTRPLFLAELLLLAAMLISSAVAAVSAMLPDGVLQKQRMYVPYVFSGLMLALVMFQFFMPHDTRMMIPEVPPHTYECTMYLGFSGMLVTLLLFRILRKGASVMPIQAGALAVIASVSVGALTLRLAEANDDIVHLLSWHYLPSLFFAVLGTLLGRFFLRW